MAHMTTSLQRISLKDEADKQFSAAVCALNALRTMVVQPQLDSQLEFHFRRNQLFPQGRNGKLLYLIL